MTVGSRTAKGPNYYGHKEAILYRTRTEILTDRRILLDGTIYTFDQIDAVDVVRLKLYIPFQIMRLIGIVGTLGAAWLAFASLREFAFISMVFYGLVAAGLGAFIFLGTAAVPTYAVRLTVGREYVYMMHDTSVTYLGRVKDAVQHGIDRA